MTPHNLDWTCENCEMLMMKSSRNVRVWAREASPESRGV